MGLCMILLIWVQTWTQIVIVSLICGYVTGCQMVLSPAVLADHVGTENTAVAFGMSNFLCGIITLATRPLIIGYLLICCQKIFLFTIFLLSRRQRYLWQLQCFRLRVVIYYTVKYSVLVDRNTFYIVSSLNNYLLRLHRDCLVSISNSTSLWFTSRCSLFFRSSISPIGQVFFPTYTL